MTEKKLEDMYEQLHPIFDSLKKAKDKLGEKMYQEIRERLIDGAMSREEANYLQNKRRDLAAAYMGMTRNEYEDFIKGKKVTGSLKPKSYRELFEEFM